MDVVCSCSFGCILLLELWKVDHEVWSFYHLHPVFQENPSYFCQGCSKKNLKQKKKTACLKNPAPEICRDLTPFYRRCEILWKALDDPSSDVVQLVPWRVFVRSCWSMFLGRDISQSTNLFPPLCRHPPRKWGRSVDGSEIRLVVPPGMPKSLVNNGIR